MIEAINNAKVNEDIDVSESESFKIVSFSYEKELGYTWMALTKKGTNKRGYPIHPMASTRNVKFFKTLAGAKRNFIKRIA